MNTEEIDLLRKQNQGLIESLKEIGDFRPGYLDLRYRKCGKPSCHCHHEGHPGHGPHFSLTRSVNGKTVTRVIPDTEAETTKKQIAEYQRFKTITEEITKNNIHICDLLLDQKKAERNRQKEAEKGGSKKK